MIWQFRAPSSRDRSQLSGIASLAAHQPSWANNVELTERDASVIPMRSGTTSRHNQSAVLKVRETRPHVFPMIAQASQPCPANPISHDNASHIIHVYGL
jgi:hypothetical protein